MAGQFCNDNHDISEEIYELGDTNEESVDVSKTRKTPNKERRLKDEEKIQIINELKEHPCLWKRHETNKQEKTDAIEMICKQFSIPKE